MANFWKQESEQTFAVRQQQGRVQTDLTLEWKWWKYLSFFCIVLDHLTIMVANFPPKIMSPLVRCLVISNALAECGNIFDNLKKEKKEKRYNAL